VPNARLIIAGANHHTKPGYWESIRDSHGPNPRIEFLGYVPETGIAELFSRSSVVVMPYDSATGSSGPAHQACEYGVPIVCADIPDFRVMAADADMAIAFYNRGDAGDLADKLASILNSPAQQRMMAEQNFLAGLSMTMPNVVKHYLRWFELAQRKKALEPFLKLRRPFSSRHDLWRRLSFFRRAPMRDNQGVEPSALLAQEASVDPQLCDNGSS